MHGYMAICREGGLRGLQATTCQIECGIFLGQRQRSLELEGLQISKSWRLGLEATQQWRLLRCATPGALWPRRAAPRRCACSSATSAPMPGRASAQGFCVATPLPGFIAPTICYLQSSAGQKSQGSSMSGVHLLKAGSLPKCAVARGDLKGGMAELPARYAAWQSLSACGCAA